MDENQPPAGISVVDWQATPKSVRQLVVGFLATVDQLQQAVAQLCEQVNKNSQNSSMSPSSDPPSVKRKPPKVKGQRQRGGQPGHQGKGRHLKPLDQVSRFVVSRPISCGACGALLLAQVKLFFPLWHRVRDGTPSCQAFQEAMGPVRREVESLLQLSTLLVEHRQTQATCRNVLKHNAALWTFVDQESIKPTNNAAEQAWRRGVIWRKRSFGSQSQAGSCFVERILTVVLSLRRQQRDVLDFLTDACQALASGMAPPSLLPSA